MRPDLLRALGRGRRAERLARLSKVTLTVHDPDLLKRAALLDVRLAAVIAAFDVGFDGVVGVGSEAGRALHRAATHYSRAGLGEQAELVLQVLRTHPTAAPEIRARHHD